MTTFQLIQSDYRKYRKYGANFFVILLHTRLFIKLLTVFHTDTFEGFDTRVLEVSSSV